MSRHIVDRLIEERAPKLTQREKVWSLIKAIGYPLLGYRKAVQIADAIADLPGTGTLEWVSDYLSLKPSPENLDQIPETGGCVVIANHPGGIADGVAVWEALRQRRPDVCFFANRDALRVSPGLSELIIPVEWRQNFRSRENARETLKSALDAFRSDRCVVIFPAGRMAEWSWKEWRLREKPWMPTAVSFARRFGQPIIPLGVRQRMPVLYYALAQIHVELKDMTVFQGFIGKKGAHYPLRFGQPIDPKSLPESEAEATELIRDACERLAWGR
ncbi:1-acyl-sn-glycerol-3-phosphate acyltransferase [Hyphobacterium sp. HN65]|uniref:1-acyl-sn-glycerol-3-phosphate acyltransferase n=1 Tax=Hyphobacterium lacteum TaxID=3116575 RepID=A0ABU7LVE9_9PROT|nr:1-acyl-sn-glycerol-3-phosphate acyltransferase [Hyphobacterium sp. HN65]MEE2527309.1 1-acyl-sn-glycerol-3-phosphate acyltransferase [Hyphobacterium sp. HN65]